MTVRLAKDAPRALFSAAILVRRGTGATPRTTDGTPAYADEWRFLLGDMH